MNQAACLNLLTNAVVVWNTVYIARVIDELRTEGHEVRDEDADSWGSLRKFTTQCQMTPKSAYDRC